MTSAPTVQEVREQRVRKVFSLLFNMVLRPDTKGRADADAVVTMLARNMAEEERTLLLQLLIDSYPPHIAGERVRECMEGAGLPDWSEDHSISQARFWAARATAGQIDAFAAVCFENMPPERQRAFLDMVSARVDALPERRAANQ